MIGERQEQLLLDLRREAEAARAAGDMPVAAFGYAEAIKLLPTEGADALAYELRLARAECLHAAGDYAAELDEVERLEALAVRLGDPRLQSTARLRRAAILGLGGDARAGRALAAATLEAASAGGDDELAATALLILAELSYSLSDYVASAEQAAAALAICRHLGDQRGEARALRLHGLATLNGERPDAARAELDASLALARASGDQAAEALALNAIGVGSADLAQARFVYRQALALVETLGDRESESTIANNLGIVYAALGLYGQARQYALRAVRLARAIGALELIATCLETLGRALVGLGQVAQARTALREAHTLATSGGNRHTAAICLLGLARADLLEGEAEEAVAWLEQAGRAFSAIGAPAELAHALAWRAAAELALGAPELALEHTRQAVELLRAGHVSVEFPAQEVWWWRYATLQATEGAASPGAREALAQTWAALHGAIATLSDMGLRRCYLGRVSLNRRILEAVAGDAELPTPAPPDSHGGLHEQLTRLLAVAAGMNELHAAAALRELFLDEVAELTGADRILFVVGASPHEPAALLERGAAPTGLAALVAAARPLLHEATRRRRGLLRAQLPGPEPPPPDALGPRSALAVPLISGAQVVGSLYAEVPASIGPFTSGDLELVSLLATQAATAMENGRLYEQARRARADLERLVEERTADLQAANKALERQAAEAQAMRASAEAASAAKSIFLANVSHELRTPLNAVIGFAQLLSRDEAMGHRQRELAQIIGRSGEHLLGMFNDVLELSKVEAGRLTISPGPFDLRRLLDDVSGLFQMRAEAKRLRFSVELAPDVPHYLVGDEGRLRQVLINLISNAVKFTSAGAVSVRARAQQEANHVRLILTVEDSGAGLRPEELATLFQPFAQTASGRGAQEGSGLGLALSRQLARLMGGDIHVESTPGVGTVFSCEALLDAAAEPPAAEADRRPARLVTNGRRYKALVAEEQWQQRRLLAAWLGEAGLEVREASDGIEALAIWSQWRPHITLIAAKLPPVDGADTARQIKASPAGRSTVIIGLAPPGARRPADFDDLLEGPLSHETLLERIAAHLGLDLRDAAEDGAALYPALRAADLATLPPELRAELAHAAAESDPRMVDAAVARVAALWPAVGARLAALAAEFQFEIIEALAREP